MRKTQLGIIILLVSTFLSAEPALVEPGWNPSVKSKLIEVIKAGKGKNLPVVFDFDNTLVCRDISETTFADMIENGTLSKENVSTNLISNLYNDFSLRQTYDAYLNEKGNEKLRDVGHVNGYAWAVQVMASLNPAQIVNATEKTYAKGASEKLKGPDEHENAPYFYPEMVELVAELIKADYDVWVISASNVWAVRWMVSKVLNEKLLTKGTAKGIDPKQVIGISTLLKRSDGRFFKDSTLTSKNNAYLLLDKNELEKFKLTSHIIHPVSAYNGKQVNISKWIKKRPYLVAGDSPGDFAMLSGAKHKLWIARLDSPEIQEKVVKIADHSSWIFQPTLTKQFSGFIAKSNDLATRINMPMPDIKKSLKTFKKNQLLANF